MGFNGGLMGILLWWFNGGLIGSNGNLRFCFFLGSNGNLFMDIWLVLSYLAL